MDWWWFAWCFTSQVSFSFPFLLLPCQKLVRIKLISCRATGPELGLQQGFILPADWKMARRQRLGKLEVKRLTILAFSKLESKYKQVASSELGRGQLWDEGLENNCEDNCAAQAGQLWTAALLKKDNCEECGSQSAPDAWETQLCVFSIAIVPTIVR